MLPIPGLDSYQKQLEDLRRSYASLGAPAALSNAPVPQKIRYFDGIEKVKEYQRSLSPGASEIVMDKNEDIFYVVSKDDSGESPKLLTLGRFTLEQEQAPEAKYVTKDDLAAFEQRIVNLLQEAKHE